MDIGWKRHKLTIVIEIIDSGGGEPDSRRVISGQQLLSFVSNLVSQMRSAGRHESTISVCDKREGGHESTGSEFRAVEYR